MMALLLVPVANALLPEASRKTRALAMAYAAYLVTCASNPTLFSSMGILILAVLLANIFREHDREIPTAARAVS